MRRYRFRLAPVLRVRRTEQDLAQAALLAAHALVRTEQEALARREDAYAAAVNAQAPRRAADFVYEQAHRAALGTTVLAQRSRLAEAEQALEAARRAHTAAASRVGALERLDERQRAEHHAHALREDDLIVDDLVVSRVARSDR